MNTKKTKNMDICVAIRAIVNFLVRESSNSLFCTVPVAAMKMHHLYRSKVKAKKRNINLKVSKLLAMQSAILELK
jgi:tRNA G26 N,N-dimethylase Trm1